MSQEGGGGSTGGFGQQKRPQSQTRRNVEVGNEEKAQRLRQLRQKKERLGYAVERLGLQSQQRQRQLRQSIGHLGQNVDREMEEF